jgi:hypothetical protein
VQKDTLLYYPPRISSGIQGIAMNSPTGAKMALEKELETYKKNLPELKTKHEGKFVLIHGEKVVDTFSTYEDAIKAGYQQFKAEPFLVKQIHAIEPVFFVSRYVAPTVTVQ